MFVLIFCSSQGCPSRPKRGISTSASYYNTYSKQIQCEAGNTILLNPALGLPDIDVTSAVTGCLIGGEEIRHYCSSRFLSLGSRIDGVEIVCVFEETGFVVIIILCVVIL